MEIKIDRFSSSSSEVEVVHTKHVFTAHLPIMAARAMPMAGGTSRLATDEIRTLCSRLHKKKKRSDNVLEHCIGGIEQFSTGNCALLLARPSSALSCAYVVSSIMTELRSSSWGAFR